MKDNALNILLVNPKWNGFGNRKKIKVSEKKVHPLTLGIVAGIITGHNKYHRVRIVDQANERIPFDEEFDLVGITVNTYTAPMAYRIAEEFRERKVPVIFGGFHATVKSDECLKYADSVLVGEAEEKLPELIDDFIAGDLKRIYVAETLRDLSKIPIPGRDLFALKNACAAYVQVTRGCSNICKFCYLRNVSWAPYRKRPVDDVIKELKNIRGNVILFVDDNVFVDREFCLELSEKMKPLKKYWWIQAPTTIAYDDELLKAIADSGCFSVSYGFQTVSRASLKSDSIFQNKVKDYKRIVEETQKYGILVDGTFVFGFDGDDEDIFENTVNMIMQMGLDTYLDFVKICANIGDRCSGDAA